MSSETITLTRPAEVWIAIDERTGITARGDTRTDALDSLDEAVAKRDPEDDATADTVAIVKTADVLHGKPRIEGTRIGVLMVGDCIRGGGQSVEDVLESYPDLTVEQVEAALAYYDAHPDEMAVLREEEGAIIEQVRNQSRAK